jgi:hypothetical protein
MGPILLHSLPAITRQACRLPRKRRGHGNGVGVIGKKEAPVQKLAEGAWKDEAEKQAMIAAVAADESLKAEQLLPMLASADETVQQRGSNLFLARADGGAVSALWHLTAESDGKVRAGLIKILGRAKQDLLKPVVAAVLKDTSAERLRASWALLMELPPEISEPYLDRALESGPPPTRVAALQRLLRRDGLDNMIARLGVAAADRDARVRRVAVDALTAGTGQPVFEIMIERISGDDNAEIRAVAGDYL